jgi:hypothetical protein
MGMELGWVGGGGGGKVLDKWCGGGSSLRTVVMYRYALIQMGYVDR